MQSLWLIFQLLFCLFLGFIFARRVPQWLEKTAFKILPYFTYILLIAIAMEFSQTLHSIASPAQILGNAISIALATSIGAFLCCYILFKAIGYKPQNSSLALYSTLAMPLLHLLLAMQLQSLPIIINLHYMSAHGIYC